MARKKVKHYTKDILERVTIKKDLDDIKKNKEELSKKNNKVTPKKLPKIVQWWEKELKIDEFVTKENNGKWFGHYSVWKKNIWIGPYESEQEVNKVIKDYVRESKKPIGSRILKNIHSIILK